MHKLYQDLVFSLKKIVKYFKIFKYIWIFENLRINIQMYSVVTKSTNEYLNIFILGKWNKYEYE